MGFFKKDVYIAESGQELLVSLNKDPLLNQFTEEALSSLDNNRELTTPRAEYLAKWVNSRIRIARETENPNTADGPSLQRKEIYRNSKRPMLGEFTKGKGTGICREFNLLFHVALAKAGKNNKVVRGIITLDNETAKHLWVEYEDTKTGEEMYGDAMLFGGIVLPLKEAYERFNINPNELKKESFIKV